MPEFTDSEKDQIIRGYFSSDGKEEKPGCPHCGEFLNFQSEFDAASRRQMLKVFCPECRAAFTWWQDNLDQSWSPLHLQYFLERYRTGQPVRCPIDDSRVTYAEFSDNVLDFRCPYCNRRGQIAK
ncbi:MAG: hypothetical protein ACRD1R_18355 [Acidobacteriota bacterium]